MTTFANKAVFAAATACCAAPAFAADIVEQVVEPEPVNHVQEFGGWYVRGDLDYHKPDFRGAD